MSKGILYLFNFVLQCICVVWLLHIAIFNLLEIYRGHAPIVNITSLVIMPTILSILIGMLIGIMLTKESTRQDLILSTHHTNHYGATSTASWPVPDEAL